MIYMSTPKEQKKLWKNIDWKSKDEKLAFFNQYFKKSDEVADHMRATVQGMKTRVIGFIKEGNIKEGDKTRSITMKDIIDEINKI